jgi:hypothetical protein
LYLRIGEVVSESDWNIRQTEPSCGLQAQVAVDNGAVALGNDRDAKAELADDAGHPFDVLIVFAWVPRIFDQPVDRPRLDY